MDYPTFPSPKLPHLELMAARRLWIQWRYVTCGWSRAKIAGELGIMEDAVSAALGDSQQALTLAEQLGPEIERLYVEEKLTILEAAGRVKLNPLAVRQILSDRGVKLRKNGRGATWEQVDIDVRDAWDLGDRTVKAIATRIGRWESTVALSLARLGLTPVSGRTGRPKRPDDLTVDVDFVRRVGNGAFQGRGFVSKFEIHNLGLYHPSDYGSPNAAALAAARAGSMFKELVGKGLTPWEAIRELQQTVVDGRPVVAPSILPKWVVRVGDGTYSARAKNIRLPSTHSDPWDAHVSMRALLQEGGPV